MALIVFGARGMGARHLGDAELFHGLLLAQGGGHHLGADLLGEVFADGGQVLDAARLVDRVAAQHHHVGAGTGHVFGGLERTVVAAVEGLLAVFQPDLQRGQQQRHAGRRHLVELVDENLGDHRRRAIADPGTVSVHHFPP